MPRLVLGEAFAVLVAGSAAQDRKSTRLNSSHANISYAVFCLKKKNKSMYYCTGRVVIVRFARTRNAEVVAYALGGWTRCVRAASGGSPGEAARSRRIARCWRA